MPVPRRGISYVRSIPSSKEVAPSNPKETIVEQSRGMFKSALSKIGFTPKEPSEADLLNKRKPSSEHGSKFKYNTPFKEGNALDFRDLNYSSDYAHVETEDGAKVVFGKTIRSKLAGPHRGRSWYIGEEILTENEKKDGRKPYATNSIKLGDTITINGEQKKIKSIIVTHDVGEDFKKRAEAESPAKPQMNQAV